jgi:DNA (cytosine-5)-methyltransferase 1
MTKESYRTVEDAFEGLPEIGPNESSTMSDHEAPTQRQSTIDRCRNTDHGEQLYESYETNRRLDPTGPSFTIIGEDWKYAHPHKPRGITVRERARIQSFADDYELCGDESSRRQQLANAVPPRLTERLADSLPL